MVFYFYGYSLCISIEPCFIVLQQKKWSPSGFFSILVSTWSCTTVARFWDDSCWLPLSLFLALFAKQRGKNLLVLFTRHCSLTTVVENRSSICNSHTNWTKHSFESIHFNDSVKRFAKCSLSSITRLLWWTGSFKMNHSS